MWFDRKGFTKKCNDILDDIEQNKLRSPAWLWMGIGAITGLVTSCLKMRRKTGKPILAKMTKPEDCVDVDLGSGIEDRE